MQVRHVCDVQHALARAGATLGGLGSYWATHNIFMFTIYGKLQRLEQSQLMDAHRSGEKSQEGPGGSGDYGRDEESQEGLGGSNRHPCSCKGEVRITTHDRFLLVISSRFGLKSSHGVSMTPHLSGP